MKKISLPKRFLLVDDDSINNLIISHLLKTTISSEIEIISFTEPAKGLEFIKDYKSNKGEIPTILFLDLNMPLITGWDFIEHFNKLDKKVTRQFAIYILSSSVDNRDIERARAIPEVADYLMKPLTSETLLGLF